MPELPEVETTVNGIKPHAVGEKINSIVVRNPKLRWPVPYNISSLASKQRILNVERRAKYLIVNLEDGNLILHLGMSGKLRVLPKSTPVEKHDHVDIILSNNKCLRLTDHRRFGACLWSKEDPLTHKLLVNLGPEPLTTVFNSNYLMSKAHNRKVAIKNFIMDNKVVVGVGNIYATEALFLSGIHPEKPAKDISRERMSLLVKNIKKVLRAAIKAGGTTFRDFLSSDGSAGYFVQKLYVYGRVNQPCKECGTILKNIVVGQRSSVFCPNCQNFNHT